MQPLGEAKCLHEVCEYRVPQTGVIESFPELAALFGLSVDFSWTKILAASQQVLLLQPEVVSHGELGEVSTVLVFSAAFPEVNMFGGELLN